jgi:hypothetical protein
LLIALTKLKRFYRILYGERYSFKIKYRFQVLVPKRQILPCAVMRTIRSALTCLSVPFTTFPIPTKTLLTVRSELSFSFRIDQHAVLIQNLEVQNLFVYN